LQQHHKFSMDLLKTQHATCLLTVGEEHKKLAVNSCEEDEQSQKMLQRAVTVEARR
jgi:hypothetical protein